MNNRRIGWKLPSSVAQRARVLERVDQQILSIEQRVLEALKLEEQSSSSLANCPDGRKYGAFRLASRKLAETLRRLTNLWGQGTELLQYGQSEFK